MMRDRILIVILIKMMMINEDDEEDNDAGYDVAKDYADQYLVCQCLQISKFKEKLYFFLNAHFEHNCDSNALSFETPSITINVLFSSHCRQLQGQDFPARQTRPGRPDVRRGNAAQQRRHRLHV